MSNKQKKESEYSNGSTNLDGSAIRKIKTEIRNWYGSLSVKELVRNKALVDEIEKLERLLSGQAVVS